MTVKELTEAVGRDADGVRCECGGYGGRDVHMTMSEIENRSCGRDEPTWQCCSRAFVCGVCGTRWLGMAEAPEMK